VDQEQSRPGAKGDQEITRRDFVRGAAATGIVIGGAEYVKPALRLLGVSRLESAASAPTTGGGIPPAVSHGCTPGFWANNGGGGGVAWWSSVNDAQWGANGGRGTNPFSHATLFNSFFTPNPALAGMTMWDVANGGGGPIPATPCAAQLVAAYLNASFGSFPFSTSQLSTMWSAATAGGTATLRTLQTLLDTTNNQCDAQTGNG
jgi:hypothetical protein